MSTAGSDLLVKTEGNWTADLCRRRGDKHHKAWIPKIQEEALFQPLASMEYKYYPHFVEEAAARNIGDLIN